MKQATSENLFGHIRESQSISISSTRGKWVLLVAILGSSMAFIDSTAMNIVFPVLQIELDATIPQVQWIAASYAIFLASLMMLGGALGDKFGRKRIFAMGVVIFSISSIWCGLSPSTSQLSIARAFQGIGGALLVPGSLAIINVFFKDGEKGKAIGIWSAFTAVTTALGPILGGWLSENYSWRLVFFINIPIAIVVLGTLILKIPESRGEHKDRKLDIWGSCLITGALGSIVFGLIESSNIGYSNPYVINSFILGFILLCVFVYVESRVDNPIMPLSLFRSRTFAGANVATFLFWGSWAGAIFFIPFNLIQVQGYTPTEAGLVFLPVVVPLFLISRKSGALIERYGAKLLLVVGQIIAALGYIMFVLPEIGGSYWRTFFAPLMILGVGMAISIAPMTTALMNSVPESYSGLASGVNNTLGRIGGLMAITVFGLVALITFNMYLDSKIESINVPSEIKEIIDDQRTKLAAIEVPDSIDFELKRKLENAIDFSFIGSFRILMMISAGILVLNAFIALLTIEGKRKKSKGKDL